MQVNIYFFVCIIFFAFILNVNSLVQTIPATHLLYLQNSISFRTSNISFRRRDELALNNYQVFQGGDRSEYEKQYELLPKLPTKMDINRWRIFFSLLGLFTIMNVDSINKKIGMVCLLITHYSLLITHYSLLITHYSCIEILWNTIRTFSWFRHDMFEPIVAVTSFFVWIHGWLLVDYLSNKFNWWSAYRLDSTPTKSADSTQLPQKKMFSKWYSGWPLEMVIYLAPLWAISSWTDWFEARRLALEFGAPSIFRIVKEIAGGLFFYDLFFTIGHIILHKLPSKAYRVLHGKHHLNKEVRAADTVRLTPIEETIDVICSIAGLRLMKAHPLSRSLYNIVITFLLVELHCGYDFAWSPQHLLPFNLMSGARKHHEHHRVGNVNFQKFFNYFDNLIGTNSHVAFARI